MFERKSRKERKKLIKTKINNVNIRKYRKLEK
jgi:hypothetical protein